MCSIHKPDSSPKIPPWICHKDIGDSIVQGGVPYNFSKTAEKSELLRMTGMVGLDPVSES